MNNPLETPRSAWRRVWQVGRTREQEGQASRNRRENRNKKNRKKKAFRTQGRQKIKQYHQLDLHKRNITIEDAETFGHEMGSKDESTFRVVFHNVNCFPIDYRDPKSREAISQLYKSEADVYAMAEIGLNWGSIDAGDQWYHRVRGHLPVKSSLANNKHQVTTTKKQFGGVAVCVLGDSVHKVRSKGNDPTGLGRWTWSLLEGKQHHLTRIVSVYRPSISSGENTVDAQHTDYLRSNDDLRSPRQAIYEDLQTQINVWKASGENIIICIDANENILEGATRQFFQENDMEEAILSTHPNKPSPATCNKNEHRVSIDGIFCTRGLIPVAAGYRPFNEGPKSDHRILWVDFVKKSVLGNESPRMKPPSARRLKTQDPRMIKKYNKQTHKAMLSHGLYKKLEEITTEAKSGWSPQLTEKYDALNKQKIECRSEVLRYGYLCVRIGVENL